MMHPQIGPDAVGEFISSSDPSIDLQLLRNRVNMGGGVSRNRGIEAARTDFVALLDADDEWKPDHLSSSLALLSSQNLDLVFGFPPEFANGPRYTRGLSPLEFIFVQGGIAQTSSFVFRNLPVLRFDATLLKHQDFDFIMGAFAQRLALGQLDFATTRYHDVKDIQSRVSKQRRPRSSRKFLLKWRSQMSPDARLSFIVRFHFYNRPRISLRMAAWSGISIIKSGAAFSQKLRLGSSVSKAFLRRPDRSNDQHEKLPLQ